MLCQKCGKKQATTYVKTIMNGTLSEYSLCGECAAEMGYGNWMPAFGFNSFIKNFFEEPSGRVEECPACGMTLQEIMKTGRVGCSRCYEKFHEALMPSIKRIHGTATHKGKAPGKSSMLVPTPKAEMTLVDAEPLEMKRRLLQSAIEDQRFEDAARLRDEIKILEGSAQNGTNQ